MNDRLPLMFLVRHAETAWSLSGQHTGLTDLPLTARGEENARSLRGRLSGIQFAVTLRSPLQRATRTCELAGFGSVATNEPNLVEWNYGDYEGLRTADIHRQRPGWQIFQDGCPGGESPEQVAARADRVLQQLPDEGNLLIFSSGHFLRMLAMRRLGLEFGAGRIFTLDPGSVSILGCEGTKTQAVVRLWNDTHHLAA